ncbi:Phosphate regulon sensor protein PhoR (SphS) [hydrothermal vent metagenome]|uniref:histidine kinase n=1 Tax=hydrothermal vent metagenome TaxID=652676 RepID=A0A3B0T486_9ZZZZ
MLIAVVIFVVVVTALGSALLRQRKRLDALLAEFGGGPRVRSDHITSLRTAMQRRQKEYDVVVKQRDLRLVAIGATPLGIQLYDSEGAVVVSNDAAQQLLGSSNVALRERLAELVRHTRETGIEMDERVLTSRPVERLTRVVVRPVGDREGVVVALVDGTKSRRIEKVRRDFIANASHELKTPIGALRVLVEALVATSDVATKGALVERLSSEVVRMSALVDDVLDLARVESDVDEEAFERTNIADVVQTSLAGLASESDRYGVKIDVGGIDPDLWVCGDHRQLESAITNLMDNAVKYTAAASRRVPVDVQAQLVGDAVVITVSDAGIGIPEHDIDRIFERFYRVDRARSRETGGTGLGLAIVRHVALNHGGTVSVESVAGEGSTFRIELKQEGPCSAS